MPKGHAPKREAKKQKKKASKEAPIITSPIVGATEVEVIKKRRKTPREAEES